MTLTARTELRAHLLVKGVFVALVAGALALGTASAASAASRQHVTNSQYGFSVSLPSGWYQISLNKADIGTMLGNAKKVNPSLQRSLASEAATDAAHGVLLFAVGTKRDSGGSYPNVNVIVEKGTATVPQLETVFKQALTSSGGKGVSAKAATYPFGPAAVGTYYEPDSASNTGKIYGTQIYVAKGSNVYIITFTSAQKSVETKAASSTMSSWHFS